MHLLKPLYHLLRHLLLFTSKKSLSRRGGMPLAQVHQGQFMEVASTLSGTDKFLVYFGGASSPSSLLIMTQIG